MYEKQYCDLFVTNPAGFGLNTGNKNPIVGVEEPSLNQTSMRSPLVFNSLKNK